MRDRTLPTPKSLADVDRIIEQFRQLYRRQPNAEEAPIFEYIRQLLIGKEFAAENASAD